MNGHIDVLIVGQIVRFDNVPFSSGITPEVSVVVLKEMVLGVLLVKMCVINSTSIVNKPFLCFSFVFQVSFDFQILFQPVTVIVSNT